MNHSTSLNLSMKRIKPLLNVCARTPTKDSRAVGRQTTLLTRTNLNTNGERPVYTENESTKTERARNLVGIKYWNGIVLITLTL
jgi:hypothetical protein